MKKNKKITAYCIAFNDCLCVDYIKKTKKDAIRELRLDDADRMSWAYRKKHGASCVKIFIERA